MTSPPLTVRCAGVGDLDAVEELLRTAARWTAARGFPNPWPVPYPMERVRPRLEAGDVYLAGEPGAPPIATVTLQWEDLPYWGARPADAGYIHRLAVRPERHAEGWGRRLIAWAEERTAAAGRPWLRLDCVAANPGIRRYYTEQAFRQVGEVTVGGVDCVLLERPVPSRGARA